MAIVPMQKMSICASKSKRPAILKALQTMEVIEMRESDIVSSGLNFSDTSQASARFDRSAKTLDDAIKIAQRHAPASQERKSLIPQKELVSRKQFTQINEDAPEILKRATELLRLTKDIQEAKAAILKSETHICALEPWKDLEIPLDYRGTKDVACLIGSFAGKRELSELIVLLTKDDMGSSANLSHKESLSEQEPVTSQDSKSFGATPALDIAWLSYANNLTSVVIFYHRSAQATVEANAHAAGFVRPASDICSLGIPQHAINRLSENIKEQKVRIQADEEQLTSLSVSKEDFYLASDYYRMRAERYRILATIPQSKSMFFLEGWVQAKQFDVLSTYLEEHFDALVEKEEAKPNEEVPTLLHNNRFSATNEAVLASYGLPKHGQVDPTTVMSFFYVFFFGMMLSDAGYGLLMTGLCAFVLARFKYISKGIQKMLQLFFWCGLSTTFWGFMYGGFFGNAIDTVATTFFGYHGETLLKPLWFDPMSNPMVLLVWCLLFGVIHLFAGLAIKGYQILRQGDIFAFVSEVLAWFVFLLGLIFMLVPSELFASIAGMHIVFPAWVGICAQYGALIGAFCIIVTGGRGKKNWILRFALGAYDLYGVTGWLSDVLSYSRLLALGLTTGVIANVINMMCGMVGAIGGIPGAILFTCVFVFGHAMNMAINLLGAYVHTNRLQFVEFFGKFYEAGGKAFTPFASKFRYVELREDN